VTRQPEAPEWTDHDVSDPGITLLQALLYAVPAVVFGLVAVVVVTRRRRRPVKA
jgi:hypothetical protein